MNSRVRPEAVIELDPMKTRQLALTVLAAVLLQPLVGLVIFFPFWREAFSSIDIIVFYSIAVLIVSSLVVLLLGVPCFDALNATGRLSLISLSCCGIFIGALPYLLVGYPQKFDRYGTAAHSHGYLLKFSENVGPATAAWLAYAETALGFGLHGLVGSLVFYFSWRRYGVPAR